ncbi:MAG: diguanylate cyclase [Lachnospiraceae bacterium]|nr:diguanylate cyclase [Lachnospiraceae bacterium]
MNLVPVGVFWKDTDRRFLGANQMFLDYYGLKSVDQLIGKNDEDMGWHIDPDPFKNIELRVIRSGESVMDVPGECIVRGKVRKIKASKCPLYSGGRIVGLVGYFMDITDEIEEHDRLSYLCQVDDLTGLLNRRAYNDIVLEYENQYKQKKDDFVLIILDIDNYKAVNKQNGHEYGDLLLISVAQSLAMVAAENSTLFRYGGDEFAILHKLQPGSDVDAMMRRLVRGAEGPRNIEGVKFSIKASIGHALYSETESVISLEDLADRRMYEMKEEHKGKR